MHDAIWSSDGVVLELPLWMCLPHTWYWLDLIQDISWLNTTAYEIKDASEGEGLYQLKGLRIGAYSKMRDFV